MEPRQVFLKTREQFGKQCSFSMREAQIDEEIMPNPELMDNYYVSSYYDIGIQNVKQLALHEVSVTQLN
jgi:dynein intermediate chain 2